MLAKLTSGSVKRIGCSLKQGPQRVTISRSAHTNGSPHSTGGGSSNGAKVSLFTGGLIVGGVLAYSFSSKSSEAPLQLTSPKSSTKPVSTLENIEYASDKEIRQALKEVVGIVGKENVETDSALLEDYADSSWQTRHPRPEEVPAAVVSPKTTEEISKILKIANQYKVPVTAFSGGTSLEGHFTPVYGGLTLDMSRMNRIVAIHPDDLDVVVQPKVAWEELNEQLKPHGLMFGTDAGPGATIAGMVNTGASGINAYFYGPMRQNVVNLTVVLADGTIVKTKQRAKKSSAGYNLAELFVGSEGTLGIVTEVTLKLHPIPAVTRVGLLTFSQISDATDLVQEMLKFGVSVNAIELLDDEQMRIINQSGTTKRKWDEKHTLLLRFAGATDTTIDSSISKVKQLSSKHNLIKFDFAKNAEESLELWSARKNALWSIMGAFPDKRMWTTDVAVPISHMSRIIADSKEYVKQAKIISAVVGHVGDGNFHLLLAYDPETEKEAAADVADWLAKRAIELEGTCTGEHGIGAGKRHYLLREVGPDTVAVMRQIKAALDPNTILNPGKVFQTSQNDISDHV